MKLACSKAELQQLLNDLPFTRHLGYRIHRIADGECSLDLAFQDHFERPGGVVSGPVYMAAADVAMWLAIKTKLGLADSSVTAEMKASFLSGAKRTGFRCTAKVLKVGRRLIYGVAECTDASGKLFTHHTLTYIRGEASRDAGPS